MQDSAEAERSFSLPKGTPPVGRDGAKPLPSHRCFLRHPHPAHVGGACRWRCMAPTGRGDVREWARSGQAVPRAGRLRSPSSPSCMGGLASAPLARCAMKSRKMALVSSHEPSSEAIRRQPRRLWAARLASCSGRCAAPFRVASTMTTAPPAADPSACGGALQGTRSRSAGPLPTAASPCPGRAGSAFNRAASTPCRIMPSNMARGSCRKVYADGISVNRPPPQPRAPWPRA